MSRWAPPHGRPPAGSSRIATYSAGGATAQVAHGARFAAVLAAGGEVVSRGDSEQHIPSDHVGWREWPARVLLLTTDSLLQPADA